MTNAEARFSKSLPPRKPEGSLGRTAQDVHLDSHTAPELGCVCVCGGGGGGKREIIYLSLHSHHQNVSCIKMGSDESHFNASLIVRDKVTRQCPQTTTFEEKGEPKRIRAEDPLLTNALPLG